MTHEDQGGVGPAVFDGNWLDITKAVQSLLAKHGLHDAPQDHVAALAGSVRRLLKQRPLHAHALASRQREQALACVRALRRHMKKPPRRAGTTDDKRRNLIELLNPLHAIVKVAAASGVNAAPVLRRLEADEYTADDLVSLERALEAIPAGSGAAASPEADYLRLLRGGVMAWEACCRSERYTYNQHNNPPSLDGPLPDFLRELIELARLPQPTDAALHKHLRKLKNL